MKKLPTIAVIVASASLIIGIILRFVQVKLLAVQLTANAFLRFTDTALLFAIVFILFQLLQAKKKEE